MKTFDVTIELLKALNFPKEYQVSAEYDSGNITLKVSRGGYLDKVDLPLYRLIDCEKVVTVMIAGLLSKYNMDREEAALLNNRLLSYEMAAETERK
jgi:hypothetical protein